MEKIAKTVIVLVGLLTFILGISGAFLTAYNQVNQVTCVRRNMKQIVIGNDKSASGGFIFMIGSYSQNNEPIYKFYYQKANGGFRLLERRAIYIDIFEDSDTPYLIYCTRGVSAHDMDFNVDGPYGGIFEIHLPKGSILNKIDIDLKNIQYEN